MHSQTSDPEKLESNTTIEQNSDQ